jgi:hypothetical protein
MDETISVVAPSSILSCESDETVTKTVSPVINVEDDFLLEVGSPIKADLFDNTDWSPS